MPQSPGAGHREEELLERLQAMLEARVLTRFGPMFQVERMGGAFVLAAMRVPEADWQRVLEVVNALPAGGAQLPPRKRPPLRLQYVVRAGHRDGRRHRMPRSRSIEEASGLPVFPFPKLQEYFVEMKLAVRT
jgi:hypothetical protein